MEILMKELSKAEELFLLTIWRLDENAYGVTIRRKIAELTGKEYTYGTLYSHLDQLVTKEYAMKIEGEPSGERGGRRKLYYRVTPEGLEALQRAYEVNRAVWGEITGRTFEGKMTK